MPSFGGEVKPSIPCRNLWHVKDPQMSQFRQNLPAMILAHTVPPFAARGSRVAWTRRRTGGESGNT
jgi:hypothetical protein